MLIRCIFRQIETIKQEILCSDFFHHTVGILDNILNNQITTEVFCLGLGHLSDCLIAKHQLGFIIALKEKYQLSGIKFFDPIFTKEEQEILKKLNFEVLTDNKEGKYIAQSSTLFFLPHCPKQITNNLLWINWLPENLKNLTLICNSFSTIIESTPERFLKPNANYIIDINTYTDEHQLDNCFKFTDIFNDTSIHTFPIDKLNQAPESIWKNKIEPKYLEEDKEIITNGSINDTPLTSS